MGVVTVGVNIGGTSRSKTITRTGTTWTHAEASVTAGQTGTLSTRTDDDTGILSVVSHGIAEVDKVDVGWVEASTFNRARTRMDVSSVTADTLTIDGGSGYALPVADTAIVVGARYAITFACDGDKVSLISLHSAPPSGQTESRAMVDFMTSAPVTIKTCDLEDDEPFAWASNSPITNPLAGQSVGRIEVSSLSAQAPTVSLEIIYDATP